MGTPYAADAGISIPATSSRRLPSSAPLTAAILIAAVGSANGIPRQTLRQIADSPASRKIESTLSGGGARASRAREKLLGLLEALQVVTGGEEAGGGASGGAVAAAAVKMVVACPELLLFSGKEVLAQTKQLRDMVRNKGFVSSSGVLGVHEERVRGRLSLRLPFCHAVCLSVARLE